MLVRDNITNDVSIGLYDLNTKMKIEMIKLLKNNGGRIATESFQSNSEPHPHDCDRSVVRGLNALYRVFLDAIASQEEGHVRWLVTTFKIKPRDHEIS